MVPNTVPDISVLAESVLAELDRIEANRDSFLESSERTQARKLLSTGNKQAYFVRDAMCDWTIYLFSQSSQKTEIAASELRNTDLDHRTLSLNDSAPERQVTQVADQVLKGARVVPRNNGKTAVCIPHRGFHCVAELLLNHGPPPRVVTQDWRQQFAAISNLIAIELDPAETFVSDEGVLIPIGGALKEWASQHALSPAIETTTSVAKGCIAWPWQVDEEAVATVSDQTTSTFERIAFQSDTFLTKTPVKRAVLKRKLNHRLTAIGLAVIASFIAVVCILWPTTYQPTEAVSFPSAKVTIDSIAVDSIAVDEKFDSAEPIGELTTLDISSHLSSEADAAASSVESLLAQLGTSGDSQFSLDSNALESLITKSLISSSKAQALESLPDGGPSTLKAANLPVDADATQSEKQSTSDAMRLTDDSRTAQRTIRLATATHHERIAMGPNIASTRCECEIEIGVHPKLVIEPNETVVLKGTASGTWKVALEDEEPELIVGIQSKPGSRWQLMIAVSLKDSASSLPIAIGPNDAVMVSNKLLEYHRWLGNSIPILQNAKLTRPSRSRIDYVGEIKRAERQQREVEKAIERWKTVEKLAILFFAEHEIRVSLNADSKM